MKCKNCGNELQDNALFCGVCGTKVENEQPIQQDNTQAQQASQFDNSQAPVPPKKKKKAGKTLLTPSTIEASFSKQT